MLYIVNIDEKDRNNLKEHGEIIHEFQAIKDIVLYKSNMSLAEIQKIKGVINVVGDQEGKLL